MISKLKEYDKLYDIGESPISDSEYDAMKDVAKLEAPDDPYFQYIGYEAKNGKVKLPYVLGSLDKRNPDNMEKWLKDNPGKKVLSIKLDGVSFYVEYLNGKVIFASTRGDGFYGKDITNKAKIFCPDIPKMSKHCFRGEAMLTGGIHKELTNEDGRPYKTARNAVAGILNRDSSTEQCKYIHPFFYEIITKYNDVLDTETKRMDYIVSLGLPVPNFTTNKYFENNDIQQYINFLSSCKENTKDICEIDGIVVTINDSIREDISFPKNKIAFKISEKGKETKVVDIEWNVSRTGRIIPVVIIEPLEIQGVIITRTTGFNAKYIQDNKITKGIKIIVKRAGDVIPHITEVEKSIKEVELPNNCPSCNHLLVWDSVNLVCTNAECSEAMYYGVEHFLRGMGAENITYKTLMKLGLNTIKSCYGIDEFEIASMDGFGVKKAQQVIDEIEGTLNATPKIFISSLGIPTVGKTVGKLLIEHFGDIETFFTKATKSRIEEIKGIGGVIADNIIKNIDYMEEMYGFLQEKGLHFEEKMLKLNGMKICLTGTGPIARGPLQKMIELNGGSVKNMSKSVDLLVTSDPDSQSGKSKKAREYGIKIISYKELLEKME